MTYPHAPTGTLSPIGTWRHVVSLLLIWSAPAMHCLHAAPANDSCAGAIVIPANGPFPHLTPIVNISTATTNADPGLPGDFYPGRVVRSIWFTFTPAVNAVYNLASCAGQDATATTADTVMAIYTSAGGCNGPFQLDGEIDDESCSPQASLTRLLLADTKYYVVIWKFCDGCAEDGLNNVQLQVSATIPPPNDICATATPLQLGIPLSGTTVGGADNYQLSNAGSFTGIDQIPTTTPGRDVVFSFTAPESGTYSFKVSNYDPLQNPVLYVAPNCPSTSPGAVDAIAAANRSQVTSAEEIFCLPLVTGQTIYAFIDDSIGGNQGSSFTFEVTRCEREREPNDSPVDAAVLSCGVEGSISPSLDRDFFALGNYPAGWRAFVMVDAEPARSADFALRITTYSDTVEYDSDNNDLPFRPNSPNIAGALLPGGPVFAFVNYNGPRETEPYRIYGVVQPPLSSAVVEVEPNNTPLEANSAEPNYFHGTLHGTSPSTDVDVFAFNVAEGDLIFLSLDGNPHRTNSPINAKLELLDANGDTLIAVNDEAFTSLNSTNISLGDLGAFSPSSPGEAIVYRSGAEGTFYARVTISPTAVGSSGAGSYLLSISRNCLTGSDALNHPPTLTNTAFSTPILAGKPALLTGTLWDTDLGDAHKLLVQWGDGSTNAFEFSTPGRVDFSLPHTFSSANNNLTVNLTVQDRTGATDNATVSIRVRPQAQPARFLSIGVLPNGNMHLRLEGTPQAEYRIELRTQGDQWLPLGTSTADAQGRFFINDNAATETSRFYRAVAQ